MSSSDYHQFVDKIDNPLLPLTTHDTQSKNNTFNAFEDNVTSAPELDTLLARLYKYYVGKGFARIILAQFLNLMTLSIVIFAFFFLTSCINYSTLLKITDNSICTPTIVCSDSLNHTTHKRPRPPSVLIPLNSSMSKAQPHSLDDVVCTTANTTCIDATFSDIIQVKTNWFVVICMILFMLFWLWKAFTLMLDIRTLLTVRKFYKTKLDISDKDLQAIKWANVVNKIIAVPEIQESLSKPLTSLDIAIRIMKKENYLIAMFNKNVLNLSPPRFLQSNMFINKLLEWDLSFCIIDYIFDSEGNLKEAFTKPENQYVLAENLSKRFRIMGILNIIFFPFILIYMSILFIFKYGESFYNQPHLLGSRQWSLKAQWSIREFNELPHLFSLRINAATDHALEYIKQFPSMTMDFVARTIILFTGSALIIFLFFSFLNGHVFNLNLIGNMSIAWCFAILITIIAFARNFIHDGIVIRQNRSLKEVNNYIHDLPQEWLDNSCKREVYNKFIKLYEYRILTLIKELFGNLIVPYILLVSLPNSAVDIIKFVQEYSVELVDVGHVCQFSIFDFNKNGNPQYGSTTHQTNQPSNNGKLEKSYINFKINNPDWKDNNEKGPEFLETLKHSQHILPNPISSANINQPNVEPNIMDESLYDMLNHYATGDNVTMFSQV
jgi:hypothetical protein